MTPQKEEYGTEKCIEIAQAIARGELSIEQGSWAILKFVHDRETRAAQSMANAILKNEGTKMAETPRTTLTDGRQVYPEHRTIDKATGMQKDYVVLADEERAKGFVRPVRKSYRHLKCDTVTTMGLTLAEVYARQPNFYSGTFCVGCGSHFPVGEDGEFVWSGTDEKVGT